MRATRLAAVAASCGMAWALMVGGVMQTESIAEGVANPTFAEAVAESACDVLQQEVESVDSIILEALDSQKAESVVEESVQVENTRFFESPSCDRTPHEQEATYAPEPGPSEEVPAPEPAAASSSASLPPQTIVIDGVAISYVFCIGAAEAPWSGAGVWQGSDSTTDGSFGYFIGHNPGSFWPVASIGMGGEVIVCDSNGASRTYYVVYPNFYGIQTFDHGQLLNRAELWR